MIASGPGVGSLGTPPGSEHGAGTRTGITKQESTADDGAPGEDVAVAGDTTRGGDSGAAKKKRKIAPGGRGVASLTPDQLAKKRANDREAQRAIRERTKNQIETLEQRIRELTSQKPYQELQAVLHAKEAVEQENAEIKRRLANVVGLLQSIIGGTGNAAEGSEGNLGLKAVAPGTEASILRPVGGSRRPSCTGYSRPGEPPSSSGPNVSQLSTVTAAKVATGSTPVSSSGSPGSATGSGGAVDMGQAGGDAMGARLHQQQRDLRHGLEMGPERLGLDFLLKQGQSVNRIQNGVNGAQDSPRWHHVRMKHDWTVEMQEGARLGIGGTADAGHEGRAAGASSNDSNGVNWASTTATASPVRQQQNPLGYQGIHCAPVKNLPPTCPLDSLLLDFLSERRQRAVEGLSSHEVVGPRYPSVSSLLNPANSLYSHPLSKVFTDILGTFPDISTLPERVAVLYIMFLFMRWQISPTRDNYERLPEWMHPSPAQLSTAHPTWVDHLPFPRMRDRLIQVYRLPDYAFDNFFIPFTTTLRLGWMYRETDTLLRAPDSDELMINPVFERHLRNLDNWTLGDAFVKAFPLLADTCNLDAGGQAAQAAQAASMSPGTGHAP